MLVYIHESKMKRTNNKEEIQTNKLVWFMVFNATVNNISVIS